MNELTQSLRQRVLETLALIASADVQREYQKNAPQVDVPSELFNQWDDSYFPDNDAFREGFSSGELEALASFDASLSQASDATPSELPALDAFMQTEAWRQMSSSARAALDAMDPA